MRQAICILGSFLILSKICFAGQGAFELEELAPITPKKETQLPSEALILPEKSDAKIEISSDESKIKSEFKIKSELDKANPEAVVNTDKSAPIASKETLLEQPATKKIDLAPEKPFPIQAVAEKKDPFKTDKSASNQTESAPRPLELNSSKKTDSAIVPNASGSWITLTIMLFLTGVIFLYFWYQRFLRGKMQAHGIDIQILGQTFLDGQTKIVLLKVGPKVIVVAKSPNFCTTLDVITEPDEINLLTLGSSAAATGEDFSKVLNDFQSHSRDKKNIPHEREMKSELEQLKRELGALQKDQR